MARGSRAGFFCLLRRIELGTRCGRVGQTSAKNAARVDRCAAGRHTRASADSKAIKARHGQGGCGCGWLACWLPAQGSLGRREREHWEMVKCFFCLAFLSCAAAACAPAPANQRRCGEFACPVLSCPVLHMREYPLLAIPSRPRAFTVPIPDSQLSRMDCGVMHGALTAMAPPVSRTRLLAARVRCMVRRAARWMVRGIY